MRIITRRIDSLAPQAELFSTVSLTDVVTDLCEYAGMVERDWEDPETRQILIAHLKSAAKAIELMAEGAEIFRAFDGSGDAWYAYQD
jgi:surfactin synthase thioesterase subunit